MKKKAEEGTSSERFRRYVLAGLLVTKPEFVLKAEGSSEERLKSLLKAYGVSPDLLKHPTTPSLSLSTKPRLGLSELEWKVLAAARTVIFDRIIGPYDPPNCPTAEQGEALMVAAGGLDANFKPKRSRPRKVKERD